MAIRSLAASTKSATAGQRRTVFTRAHPNAVTAQQRAVIAVTPIRPNRLTDPLSAVMLERQQELYQSIGIVACALDHLERDPEDTSDARYALEAALPQLRKAADGLCFVALERAADAKAGEE